MNYLAIVNLETGTEKKMRLAKKDSNNEIPLSFPSGIT